MQIPSHYHQSDDRADSTMTPLIDVVFLLLIFFVCTASFQIAEQDLPSGLRIATGEGTTDVEVLPDLEDLKIVVKIFWQDDRPVWEMNGQRYAGFGEVREVLRAAAEVDSSLPVILDVADDVPLGHVIDMYDLARSVGFSTIQFAASIDR